jgi:hypothetical protein
VPLVATCDVCFAWSVGYWLTLGLAVIAGGFLIGPSYRPTAARRSSSLGAPSIVGFITG